MKRNRLCFGIVVIVVLCVLMSGCAKNAADVVESFQEGSVTFNFSFPEELVDRTIPEDTTGYIVRITPSDFGNWNGIRREFNHSSGTTQTIGGIPAGKVLIDVMAYKEHNLFGNKWKEIVAANSQVLQIVPNTNNPVSITLLEVDDVENQGISFTSKEKNMIGSVALKQSQNADEENKAVLTLLGVEGVNNLHEYSDRPFYIYEADTQETTKYARPFTMVTETVQNSRLDICFVIDISGSMGPYITGVANSIHSFVDHLSQDQSFDIRLGSIGYEGQPNQFEIFDFTSNVDDFKTFISSLRTRGGEELAHSSVDAALDLSWRASSQRIIVLITDENSDDTASKRAAVVNRLSTSNTTLYLLYDPGDYSNLEPLVERSGGSMEVLPSGGNFDLTTLGITDFILRSLVFEFTIGTKGRLHNIDLIMDTALWGMIKSKISFESYY